MKTYVYGHYCPYEGSTSQFVFMHPTKEFTKEEFKEAVHRCYIKAEPFVRKQREMVVEDDPQMRERYLTEGAYLSDYTVVVSDMLEMEEGFVWLRPEATFEVDEYGSVYSDVFNPSRSKDEDAREVIALLESTFGKFALDVENTEPTEGV